MLRQKGVGRVIGKHRASQTRRALVVKASAGLISASMAAILAMTVSAAPTRTAGSASPRTAHLPAVQLTAQQIRQLHHLSPANARQLNVEVDRVFARLGMRAGIGPKPTTGARLTAEAWSGGIHWNEAWITASYADIHSAMSKFHSHAALLAFIATIAGIVTGGLASAICYELAAGIALLDQKAGNVASVGNHGVWFAVYWAPFHTTGGYW